MNRSCYDVGTYFRDWSVERNTTATKGANEGPMVNAQHGKDREGESEVQIRWSRRRSTKLGYRSSGLKNEDVGTRITAMKQYYRNLPVAEQPVVEKMIQRNSKSPRFHQ